MHGVRACVFSMQTKTISESLLITILTLGVFGIINTEMGVVGIIPQIAERFDVTVSTAGLCVSVLRLLFRWQHRFCRSYFPASTAER